MKVRPDTVREGRPTDPPPGSRPIRDFDRSQRPAIPLSDPAPVTLPDAGTMSSRPVKGKTPSTHHQGATDYASTRSIGLRQDLHRAGQPVPAPLHHRSWQMFHVKRAAPQTTAPRKRDPATHLPHPPYPGDSARATPVIQDHARTRATTGGLDSELLTGGSATWASLQGRSSSRSGSTVAVRNSSRQPGQPFPDARALPSVVCRQCYEGGSRVTSKQTRASDRRSIRRSCRQLDSARSPGCEVGRTCRGSRAATGSMLGDAGAYVVMCGALHRDLPAASPP